MDLKQVGGLRAQTIGRLNGAGIRTAEQLALVDLRRKHVQGIDEADLREMRKQAQRAIFQHAATRVSRVTRRAKGQVRKGMSDLERSAQAAAEAALRAVRRAERAAQEALDAAQAAASGLAQSASVKATTARRAAERQAAALRKKVGRSPAAKATLQRYVAVVTRAEAAAINAAERAKSAASRAKDFAADAAGEAETRSRSLYARLVHQLRKNGSK